MSLYRAAAPLLFKLDPERAHTLAIGALKLMPAWRPALVDPRLSIALWDLAFANPIGLAAGFDKNAEVVEALLSLGFGFVEVGTVTPRPQAGNPKPRLFRLTEDQAVINRLGFNGRGIAFARAALERRNRAHGIVGVNVGRNRDSSDEIEDYVSGIRVLGPFADYCVVNISSPNTPGLRDLQARDRLSELLAATVAARDALEVRHPPLLVKVAPDLDGTEIRDIAEVALSAGVDGIIATNTTVERPATLQSRHKGEAGGLSGRPVFERSTRVLRELYAASGGKLPLIGVGGVFTGADALAKIKAGASLVQLYSGMVYEGPGIARAIAADLAARLKAEGFESLKAAVGAAHR